MKALTLSGARFNKLEKYDPGKQIISTECELYILGSAKNKAKNRKLLKKLYRNNGEYFGKKLLNINTLIDYHDTLNKVTELVLPEELVVVNGDIIGFTMPFIENNTNLELILKSSSILLEQKIKYLSQIGKILEQLSQIEDFPHQIHLGDIHEANFIIDEYGKLYAVDIDSAYISNNKPFHSKYLSTSKNIKDFPHKYIVDENGDIIPNKNSDIYCYIIMILNTLSQSNINSLPMNGFYNYMNYLEDLKINPNLLTCIEKIYHGGENENPLPYLEELPLDKLYQTNKLIYKKRTGIDLTKY